MRDPRHGWRSGVWFFLLPAGILLLLFVVWPMMRALWWGFTDAQLLNPSAAEPTGFGNYSELLSDPYFRQAFYNTALFALMVVPLQTVLAFFAALWVNRPERCWRWLRTAFFVPVVVSMPVLAVLWSILYQPARGAEMGLINRIVDMLGFQPQDWLLDPNLALPAIAFMSVWQGLGFQMMIFLAGLQGLSTEQLEAARIDGANSVQRLWYVILPGMRNSIVFVVTVTFILCFRLFVQPYLMTGGGPRYRTLSLIQYIYSTTFDDRQLGLACAGALLFLLLVGLITLLQRAFSREERA